MDKSVSIREFARLIGKSHVRVLQLLRDGKLPRNEDGSIPLPEAYDAWVERLKNPDVGGQPSWKVNRAMAKEKKDKQAKSKDKKIEERAANSLSQLNDNMNINNAMTKAKLAEKTFQARLRELEYKLKSGELVEKVAVAEEAQWLAEQVRSKLLAIPPRVSVMCEGRIARDIEEILADAINEAIKELQKCKYTGE